MSVVRSVAVLPVLYLFGCTAYDSELLGTAIEVDAPAASGAGTHAVAGSTGSSGRGGSRPSSGSDVHATEPDGGAGPSPVDSADAGVTEDAGGGGSSGGDVTPTGGRCGDGVVDRGETCDTEIDEGHPGACPSECAASTVACRTITLSGEACEAQCETLGIGDETDGDGCCPDGATSASDDDCSPSCGDGVVDADANELCEPSSATDPCPTACTDIDECTRDELVGNASTCNSVCTHTDITAPADGDGCCLPGSNAAADDDCDAVCGNDILEPGEQCDGEPDCDLDCRQPSAEELACRDVNSANDCQLCECQHCAGQILACLTGPDATANMRCDEVLVCGHANGCTGQDCYCADADTIACGLNPMGPCVAVIQSVTGTTNPFTILDLQGRTDNPLGRAAAVGSCSLANCAQECGY